MKIGRVIAGALAALGIATSANAQGWLAELNGVQADGRTGAELGVGYRLAAGNFRLIPLVGALIYEGDNDRYSKETFSNGTTVCRDHTNGQFAKKTKCDNSKAKPYGKLELAYRFGDVAALGAGVRVGEDIDPHGTLSIFVSRQIAIKGFGGPDYYGGGLTFAF